MWNLLIVDDEKLIVEEIKSKIDWNILGISKVFTANSMKQAKEVFESNRINVMLCDIEMPRGSGLELLAWVKKYSPKTELIFLTCHADFSYAKEAIHLGSLDYLLKPVPAEELEASVTKAINKIEKDSELEEYSRFGQFWFKHQSILVERFWMDIINETIPSNPEDIKIAADYRDIPFNSQMKIIPVLIGIQRFHRKMSMKDEKIIEYGLKNIAEEILTNEGQSVKFFQLKSTELIGILFLGNVEDFSRDKLEEQCEKYIFTCNQYMYCDLCCYVGEMIYAHQLASMVNELIKLKRNNVTIFNKVFPINVKPIKTSVVNTTDTSLWSVMLKNGAKDNLIFEIKKYLEDLYITSAPDTNVLYGFQQDFNQMIFAALAQKGMQAHELFNDSKTIEMNANATGSLQEMLEWVEYIIERTIGFTKPDEKSISPVIKAKNYIKLHLEKELTREEIASHVYLNPDYFDRVFKRETGLSVARFIMQERLVKAQDLLIKTNLPINVIAISVGYPNSSNFSSMFKRMTGMNPADYRKNKKES
ncbi:response regulator [Clostridium sp. SYSU_GA19001]|uniref:response regulator transcription factor n=1 Tax=Clostridium caldaquaticum TaxID=2940653 RepID=UPI0020776A2F|nr:response regulator [Clostridium caldaquaticum]MCM8710337.1 response regulator [Clostridium caldaquaticum]